MINRALLSILVWLPCLAAATPQERSFLDDSFMPRKQLTRAALGINAFANDARFGTIRQQYNEVSRTLGLRYVRILFAWNDQVQPSPGQSPFFGFYDEIARSLPRNTKALVVLTGVPTWMNDSRNWSNNDPRTTFIERWVKPVVQRYRRNRKLVAFQIWNEPNDPNNPNNGTLGLADPERYIDLAGAAYTAIRTIAPRRQIVSAATTSINQNFPETIEYNQALLDGGLENVIDLFGMHFYSKRIEVVLAPGGVEEFVQQLKKPIWVTESGEKGTTKQLEYAERVFPFLLGLSPNIKRIFIYQFTEATAADATYGLKNLTAGRTVSDLYIKLRR